MCAQICSEKKSIPHLKNLIFKTEHEKQKLENLYEKLLASIQI